FPYTTLFRSTKGVGTPCTDLVFYIQQSYSEGITDEFVKPIVMVDAHGNALGTVEDGDVVFCYNFRTDRGREITIALTQLAFPEYDMLPLNLHYIKIGRAHV